MNEEICKVESKVENKVELIFDAISSNESLARVVTAAFVATKNPTLEEVSDIKTAVSEAVTNAIVHGYNRDYIEANGIGKVWLTLSFEGKVLCVEVKDEGVGIINIAQAMEPLFTTKPEEDRTGMGFSFMEAFMDELTVESEMGQGTIVRMKREIGYHPWICSEE